ncbi:MAG: nitroreductase [Caulobacteraceae bacterium]|nr:nitroreductase [Caulobacteraceae bacterium]
MSTVLPPQPEFGAALPIGPASPAVLNFLALRRSASAGLLCEPGPDPGQLGDLLRLAARVPDHGKLAPWRFIVLDGADKAAFVERLEAIAAGRPDAEKLAGALFKIRNPPLTVTVISRTVEGKIPRWEQELSAGAVCMNLLIAAQAMGFGANWITDWYAYDPDVDALLGLAPGERVSGYVHLGTASEAPQERVRPDIEAITSRWTAA